MRSAADEARVSWGGSRTTRALLSAISFGLFLDDAAWTAVVCQSKGKAQL